MSGIYLKYFVLKPEGKDEFAAASRTAIRAYAEAIRKVDSELSESLYEWADLEDNKANQ